MLAAIVLFIFSISGLITQISCTKEVSAQADPNATKLVDVIAYYDIQDQSIQVVNLDGTNVRKVPISLPLGLVPGECRLSGDGKKVVFEPFSKSDGITYSIYSCDLNGANLKVVVGDVNREILLMDVK
jgi:Tol biopolymer transport system component